MARRRHRHRGGRFGLAAPAQNSSDGSSSEGDDAQSSVSEPSGDNNED